MPGFNRKLKIYESRITKYKNRSEKNIYSEGKIILNKVHNVKDSSDIGKILINM